MKKIKGTIVYQGSPAAGIYDLRIQAPEIAAAAVPGQFVNVYCRDGSRLLPRPISLCCCDAKTGEIRLVYRAAGAGTKEFSGMKAGEELELLGPLGNGFPLHEAAGKHVFLVGGGIGIPPMLQTARTLQAAPEEMQPAAVTAVLGYRDNTFLADEFAEAAETVLATEDGSAGTKGTVLDAIQERNLRADVIFACGPKPMLRALKNYAAEADIACWISLEERMACGIGACLACVCETAGVDAHSHVHNARVCKDGPVFAAEDVVL